MSHLACVLHLVDHLLYDMLHLICQILLLSDDVHFKRCMQIQGACNRWEHIKTKEKQFYEQADLVLALTTEDKQEFERLAPLAQVVVLPMAIQPKPMLHKPKGGVNLLYVGAPHEANINAVNFLLREVYPALKKQIDSSSMTIIGGWEWIRIVSELQKEQPDLYGTGSLFDVRRVDGSWAKVPCVTSTESNVVAPPKLIDLQCGAVRAFDTVLELEPFIEEATIFLAPIQVAGSGISTKVWLGLEHGLPVVTTRAGLQGLQCDQASKGLCAQLHVVDWDVESFVNVVKVVQYSRNQPQENHQTLERWLNLRAFLDLLSR